MPTVAGSPLTLTRPAAIHCSISRREPTPAPASTLCSLSVAAGALVGCGGRCGSLCDCARLFAGRCLRGKVECAAYLIKRWQFLQGAQAQVIKESLGRRIQ